tara:strand:- start:514 stop:3666 length:3153 start_codon:yes stop_codon:yes gene_type:complete
MAEKIVSPGVFTRERDLSFLPAGISQIGAAVIGPTVKGPAFEPVIIESFKEFEQVFGPKTLDSYVPYTIEAYLKSAGRVTVVRTLGLAGYEPKLIGIKAVESTSGTLTTAGGANTFAVLHPTHVDPDAQFGSKFNDGSPEIQALYFTSSQAPVSHSYISSYFTLSTPNPTGGSELKYGFWFSGSAIAGDADSQTGTEFSSSAPAGLAALTTEVNYKIVIPNPSALGSLTQLAGAASSSIAGAVRNTINSVTHAGTSRNLFSASLYSSGSVVGFVEVQNSSSNANVVEVRNLLTGGATNGIAYSGSIVSTTGPFAFSAGTEAGSMNLSTVQDGSIDGDSFTLYLSDDAAGDGVTTYAPATNFPLSAQTDTGNIITSNTTYSSSINTISENFIGKVFGLSPKDRVKPVYNYMLFKNYASRSFSADSTLTVAADNELNTFKTPYSQKDAYEARTPWIVSQNLGTYVSPKTTRLFKFHTRSHGSSTNYQYKVAIINIKDPASVAGSDYGSFSVQIRRVDTDGTIHAANNPYPKSGDRDLSPHIVEQHNNVTLDPNSPNFIARVIGDRYQKIDANGKVTVFGDYPNLSRHVWVEVPEEVKDQGISPDLVPFGFESLVQPVIATVGTLPTASFVGHTNNAVQRSTGGTSTGHYIKKAQLADNVYNKKIFYGFDFTDTDNYNYLLPLPFQNSTVGNNKHFNLTHCVQHPSASLAGGATTAITPGGSTINLSTKKFIVPFQGGFDGLNPARYIARDTNIVASNMLGFDLSTAEKDGSKAFKRAINAVSNPDEYDINLLITPGANHRLHSVVTTHAKNTCEDRGDALYIMDAVGYDTTKISTVTNTVKSLDSNYTATYWPWVKILDTDKNKPVWVPPSTVMAGVISKNDQVAFEWFAPAGLNRGILTEALDVPTRLTHAERDDLYEGRVNPIATFKEGICIWGQKTLQAKPSALDRINVRRLLIAAKKFISSATKYLVFENNTNATRQRFLNIANPYFESVQQRQGLYAYKVIMDATNNTPDVIDRNQMIGEIFLQPAKSAEFIILDFNILPTGAVFPE